jgi:predicted aconitase with swiveling domain
VIVTQVPGAPVVSDKLLITGAIVSNVPLLATPPAVPPHCQSSHSSAPPL